MATDTLINISTFVCGLLAAQFLPKYFSEKAKNLATKEDIKEITEKIESVKHDYASKLEGAKADLSAKIGTHGFRYENEFRILADLTERLVEVRDASLALRPILDFKDPNKSEDEIKQERVKRLFTALRDLYSTREKRRPFYPDDIFDSMLKIQRAANSEQVKYQYQSPFDKDNFQTYWDEAQKNQEEIAQLAEEAMKRIRARVTTWDSLIQQQSAS